MRLISLIVIISPVILYFICNRKKGFMNPSTAFSLLYILKIVIPTIIYSFPENISIADDFFLERSLYNDDVYIKYSIIQSIGYCMVLIGISMHKIKNTNKNISNEIERSTDGRRYRFWGYCFYFLGVVGFFMVMSKVGGIIFFFSNLGQRTYLVRDLDFETYLLSLLNYAPLVLIYSKKWTKERIKLLDIALVVLAGLMVGLGGRKALIMLVIECAAVYHYVVKPIKIRQILNFKIITICCFIFLFFTTYSKLRTPGAFEEFVNDPIEFYIGKNEGGLTKSLAGESYVPFYVSIVDYFDSNDKWDGASFLGLMSAFIPSSFYPDKPPVDDGMYWYSIAHGNNVNPPMPTRDLDGSSWPLETFGSMYANFGFIGVIVGMFFLGYIVSYTFKKMVYSNYQFKYVIFYIIMLFTFEISTLRIVQALLAFIILSFIQLIIKRKHV